jgi:hypothetical protein
MILKYDNIVALEINGKDYYWKLFKIIKDEKKEKKEKFL